MPVKLLLIFYTVKKEVHIFQNVDIFAAGSTSRQRLEWIRYLRSMENEKSFKLRVKYHSVLESK